MVSLLTKPRVRILSVVAGVVVALALWFALQVHPLGSQGRNVIITVQKGESLSAVASELHAQGVIGSTFAYRVDTSIFGGPTLSAGSYQLKEHSSFGEVDAILGRGPNVEVVSVSPGLTLNEIAVNVASDTSNKFATSFLNDTKALAEKSAFHPNGSLEGLIGPGTYILAPSDTPMGLAKKLAAAFTKKAAALGLTPSTMLNGLSAYQLITAASIVEKEGYYPSNMPQVARVIYNRLARGGPLQMDATVLYYLHRDGGTVTPAMLKTPEPYNTYLNLGLTPTPICTISKFSINAVLHAPAGSWLYFTVINKNGNEAFSTTFAQQLANEKLAEARGLE